MLNITKILLSNSARRINEKKEASKRDYATALIDAGISFGSTFCSTMLIGSLQGFTFSVFCNSLLTGGVAFFLMLTVSLKIKLPSK